MARPNDQHKTALILDTEEADATDHSYPKTITVKENAKHLHYITITFLIINKIIFCLNFFPTHHPSVISTIHMLISINQTLSNYYFKITPW